jgi:hypothetical protein
VALDRFEKIYWEGDGKPTMRAEDLGEPSG